MGIVSRRDVLRRVARGELVAARPDGGAEPAEWDTGPIVVGVDGSEGSIRVIRWAARAALRSGAPLLAVTACGTPDLYSTAAELEHDARQTLAATLERALGTDALGSAAVTQVLREGRPLPVLVGASEGARLLVVGSRQVEGLGGTRRGSLTARLVGYARCPVVALPEDLQERHADRGRAAEPHHATPAQ